MQKTSENWENSNYNFPEKHQVTLQIGNLTIQQTKTQWY